MSAWTLVSSAGATVTAMSLWVAVVMTPWRRGVRWRPARPAGRRGARSSSGWLRSGVERRSVSATLPVLLEGVARSLRSGQSARAALVEAGESVRGPLSDDIDDMAGRLAAGATLQAALAHWVERRIDVPGVRLAASAIALAADSGGSVAAAVDGVADTLREEHALVAEVRSLAAQARASAGLIVALPLVFAVVTGVADPRVLVFLTDTAVGRTCLVVGVGLDVVALVWMHRIVEGIAR